MTTVFATYRDISRVASQGLYTLLLEVFPLTAVFMAGGGIMIVLSRCSRKLPLSLGMARKDRVGEPTASRNEFA